MGTIQHVKDMTKTQPARTSSAEPDGQAQKEAQATGERGLPEHAQKPSAGKRIRT